ncbi:MAG: YhdH/YhfP family quinone oxidoreductase [Planctomycetales bacterium]|nr:YhdH/YhfP family quinone oxidoreductase [Planctomycetales bacterium]
MTLPDKFPCFMVRRENPSAPSPDSASPPTHAGVESIALDELPPGDVVIDNVCSSLNYKDALASVGNRGVAPNLPHIPGIDCAGTVVLSETADVPLGTRVLVTGYDLGSPRWGGYCRYVRVPHEWVVPLPDDVSFEEAMTYGTAGFTAAQCVDSLLRHGIEPSRGEVAVTGSTGGVGSLSVALLAKLGFQVVAITGKQSATEQLLRLGACRVAGREEVLDESSRPLLASKWSGAVDTVGGTILATLVRQLGHRGCVAACGLTAGEQLPLTVFPFLLRGVTLDGIDSAKCPPSPRREMWRRLFGEWRLDRNRLAVRECTLATLSEEIDAMLAGRGEGRVLVRPVAR